MRNSRTEYKIEPSKMKRKGYEKELRKLQVKLCLLQDWVKEKGLRAIIVFEGRDTAGKGGTIKALTERVSPRVFRVVALPAPSDREKTQMYIQRYMQHFPAAGEIVIFDRSWYNRAGIERVMGFVDDEAVQSIFGLVPGGRKIHRRWRHHTHQNLAGSWNGGAGQTIDGSHHRSASAMETEPDGSEVLQPLVRLFAGSRHDAQGDRQQARTLVYRAIGRQAASPTQLHLAYSVFDPVQEDLAQKDQASQAIK